MKKPIYILILIFFAACSKDVKDEAMIADAIIQKSDFTITNDPARLEIDNTQVGETLRFDVKITDFDTNPEAVYVLKPITKNKDKHQLNKIDYNFKEKVEIENPTPGGPQIINTYIRDSIIIKKAKSSFYQEILVPGSFDNEYTLRKMIKGKYVGTESKQSVLNNAVKIIAWTWGKMTFEGNHSYCSFRTCEDDRFTRYYNFSVNDGEGNNDVYLTNDETKTLSFVTIYEGTPSNSGEFNANAEFKFRGDIENPNSIVGVNTWQIGELKVIQKNKSTTKENTITYRNIGIQSR
jgi:hypothetical protein